MPDRVDQFESIFKRASKKRFVYRRAALNRVLLITDQDARESQALLDRVRHFLAVLESDPSEWLALSRAAYARPSELIERIGQHRPDLIVTYRNLDQMDKETPASLGVYLDTLTQKLFSPILVLPDEGHRQDAHALEDTSTVMVATDHVIGGDRLINYAVRLTQKGGCLHLCHVEDDVAFRHYLDTIEKIPDIDTDVAREKLLAQLLKEPAEYIRGCIEVLRGVEQSIRLESHVLMGHSLHDYRHLVEECRADLLVINTKDEDQLAMHGLAYPIAVEFRHVALLML